MRRKIRAVLFFVTLVGIVSILKESADLKRSTHPQTTIQFHPAALRYVNNQALSDDTVQGVYLLSSGQLLLSDPSRSFVLASLSKLVTALLLLQQGNIEGTLSVPSNLPTQTPLLGLKPGASIAKKIVLEGMLIPSANDAAAAAGQNFAARAKDLLATLGLSALNVAEPTGLDPNNAGVLQDVLILGAVALQNPVIARTVSEQTMIFEGKTYPSTNALLTEGYKGLKTGSLPQAGYHFVGFLPKPVPLLAATIGARQSAQRFEQTRALVKRLGIQTR